VFYFIHISYQLSVPHFTLKFREAKLLREIQFLRAKVFAWKSVISFTQKFREAKLLRENQLSILHAKIYRRETLKF